MLVASTLTNPQGGFLKGPGGEPLQEWAGGMEQGAGNKARYKDRIEQDSWTVQKVDLFKHSM